MAVVVIEVRRRLPFRPEDLHALVSDVRAYPEFIPWVKHLTLKVDSQDGESWTGRASALVGWRAFTERFETLVRSDPGQGRIDVSLISGPFRVLENKWRFVPAEAGGSDVSFWIRYQFKNPILQAAAAVNRELAADKIMGAFTKEAAKRFETV